MSHHSKITFSMSSPRDEIDFTTANGTGEPNASALQIDYKSANPSHGVVPKMRTEHSQSRKRQEDDEEQEYMEYAATSTGQRRSRSRSHSHRRYWDIDSQLALQMALELERRVIVRTYADNEPGVVDDTPDDTPVPNAEPMDPISLDYMDRGRRRSKSKGKSKGRGKKSKSRGRSKSKKRSKSRSKSRGRR